MERRLSILLRLSALYDLTALVVLLAMPAWLFDLFAHPVPAEPFLFRLAALPLWMAPWVYWLASRHPARTPQLVSASLALRVSGAFGITALVLWQQPAGATAYWAFVVGDLVWAGLIGREQRALSSTARAS